MVGIDSRVAAEHDLTFIDVNINDTETYKHYRPILLEQHPERTSIALPTYLLVSDPDNNHQIHGEITGAMSEAEFREHLSGLIQKQTLKAADSTTKQSLGSQEATNSPSETMPSQH